MKKRGLFIMFLFALCVGFFLRVYQVSTNPPALSWDEVSIGYNAYSILKTGRDEHGTWFPITAFAAYGDYKPVVPVYLTIPFVWLFGMNELAVRLPSVLAGTATILVTYLLVKELLPSLSIVASIASLVIAFSPWHINLSRAGFEANIATFFLGLGVYLVLKARSVPKLWRVCWIPFVLAVNTFNSARYFGPLLAVGLIVFCWKDIQKNLKLFFVGIAAAAILVAPLVPYMLSPEARLRFAEVNIFSDIKVVEVSNVRTAVDDNSIIGKIFHNRRVGYAREYLVHFFDHLEPWFLFVRGDGNPKFSIQDVGQLYMIELPLLLIGVFALFHQSPRVAWFLLFWLLAAIVPAAVARETPHALRIENSLPTWHIFIAYGIYRLVTSVKTHWRKFLVLVICASYAASIVYYVHNYYMHYPIEYSGEWQYGYKQALQFIRPITSQYKTIVITDVIGRPYMYTLFYEKFDPNEYWQTKDAPFDAAGFLNVYGFGAYRFVRGGDVGSYQKNTLYVLAPGEVPDGAHILQTIRLLNGDPVLVVFDMP